MMSAVAMPVRRATRRPPPGVHSVIRANSENLAQKMWSVVNVKLDGTRVRAKETVKHFLKTR